MKLVKKLLRLLPLFVVFCLFFGLALNKDFYTNNYTLQDYIDSFDLTRGPYDSFVDSFYYLIGPLRPLYEWFSENVSSDGYYTLIAFGIICYELWLSLLFLIFDLFNLILSLGRKLISKGGKYEDS